MCPANLSTTARWLADPWCRSVSLILKMLVFGRGYLQRSKYPQFFHVVKLLFFDQSLLVFSFLISLFFITGVKNVSIYEFCRPNFTTQNVRKHRKLTFSRPNIIIHILSSAIRHPSSAIRHPPSALFHPHFVICILLSALFHPHFSIRHPPPSGPRSVYRDSWIITLGQLWLTSKKISVTQENMVNFAIISL